VEEGNPLVVRQPLSGERDGSRSRSRAGELGEDRQVGAQPERSRPLTRSGDSAHSFLSRPALALDRAAAGEL